MLLSHIPGGPIVVSNLTTEQMFGQMYASLFNRKHNGQAPFVVPPALPAHLGPNSSMREILAAAKALLTD